MVQIEVHTLEGDMTKYVEDNPIDICVDQNDALSKEQVQLILEGNADEVRYEIEVSAGDYGFSDGELDYYIETMAEVFRVDKEVVEDWFQSEGGFYPAYTLNDHDWKLLLSHTRAYITCTMNDVPYNFNGWAYGHPIEYPDVKETLKILGVNPKEFRDIATGGSLTAGEGKVKGYFPDMPNRVAAVNVRDLYENMICLYDGVLNFCLGDLENVIAVLEDEPKNITFKKGTNVVMFDFSGGASITEVELLSDVTVKAKDVEFRNDEQIRYGIQDCCGYVHGFWKSGGIQNGK